MRRINDPYLKQVVRFIIYIVLAMAAIRFTGGYGMLGLLAFGACFALSNKTGLTMFMYMLLPFLTITNGVLVPKVLMFGLLARVGIVGMTVLLMFSCTKRHGSHKIPIGFLFVYLLFACLSSMNGYVPQISYLKILNCALFFAGILLGFRNLHGNARELLIMRASVMAFCCVIVFGSAMTLAVPSIAYAQSVSSAMKWGAQGTAEQIAAELSGVTLFSGVTLHSQFLAPMLGCVSGWVACDMLLIEQRLRPLHIALLVFIPPLIFLTRGRIGMLVFAVMVFMMFFYVMPKANVGRRIKGKLRNMVMMGSVLLVIVAIVYQAKDQRISKFLRKTDIVEADTRGLGDALTASRQGSIEDNLRDFQKNTLMGTGFQVSEGLKYAYQAGRVSIYSAPIEKGLLPVMILGEGGIVGAVVFAIFLVTFYSTCMRKGYVATLTLFTLYLTTNMAEASFFSPSGGGGVEWLMTVGGGFVIDMYTLNRRTFQHSNGLMPYGRF